MPERVKEEDKPWEVVYCRAKKCHHHIAGKHHCNIVKPLGNDDKIIDLRFAPEIVYHVGNTVWAEWKDQYGSCPVQMPTMYTLKLNTGVTLAAGQYCLVAAVSPKSKEGFPDFTRKLMVFVKADVLTIGR